jgi:hypothetical protein
MAKTTNTQATETTTYTVRGSVRGTLASHVSLVEAHRVLTADEADCGRLGGGAYSDARIFRDDGLPMTVAEWAGGRPAD